MKCKECPYYLNSKKRTEPGLCKVDLNPRWPGENCDLAINILPKHPNSLNRKSMDAKVIDYTGSPSGRCYLY